MIIFKNKKLKKKITIVIDASRNRSGGSVIYLKNFIKHLNIKLTNIKKVIIFSDKNLLSKIPNRSFLIKHNHSLLEKNIFFEIIWQWLFLPIYLKKNKIDVLYSTDSTTLCYFRPNIIFNQDILSFDKKTMQSIPFGLEKIRLYLIRFIQIRALNNANEIIFLSKFSKKLISKFIKIKKKPSINYHGVDKKLITKGKIKLKKNSWNYLKKDKIKLLYVSPLYNYKNQDTVALAYSELKRKFSNLDIKFIGAYHHNINYYNKILRNSLVNPDQFLGALNHNQVIKHIYNSDIFLFASSSETFGITLLEAMALGMPIICSKKSSLPEILKDGGVYFDPKNHRDLTKKIELLVKDKNLRKKISYKAFNLSHKYDWNININNFCEIINKIKIKN